MGRPVIFLARGPAPIACSQVLQRGEPALNGQVRSESRREKGAAAKPVICCESKFGKRDIGVTFFHTCLESPKPDGPTLLWELFQLWL